MRTVAIGIAAVLALTGCTGSSTDKSAPESSPSVSSSLAVPSPTSSPSSSPTAFESFPPAPADESKDQAAIRAAWMRYWQVLEKFASNPRGYTDFTETQQVTTGEEAKEILNTIQSLREKGLRSGGGSKFVNVVVGTPSEEAGSRTAIVSYCIDATNQVVYDENNNPVNRNKYFLKETATLIEEEDGVWRVSMIRNERSATC